MISHSIQLSDQQQSILLLCKCKSRTPKASWDKMAAHGRVIVDNMSEFEHSSSRASCTFSMQDSRVKRKVPLDTKLSKHHGSCTSTAWSRPSVCSLYHCALKSCSPIPNLSSVSPQNFPLLVAFALLLLCSLPLLCSLLS